MLARRADDGRKVGTATARVQPGVTMDDGDGDGDGDGDARTDPSRSGKATEADESTT